MALTLASMRAAIQQARNGSLKDLYDALTSLLAGDNPYIGGVAITATAAEINAAAAGSRGVVTIADATPYTVLAANSGKTHIIAEQTANITINLPVIAAGLEYKFVMGGVATE